MQLDSLNNEKNDKSNLENETKINKSENNFSIKSVEEKTISEYDVGHEEDVCEDFDTLYKVNIGRHRNADSILYIIKTTIDEVDYIFSLKGTEKSDSYSIEFHTVKYGYALVGKQDGLGTSFIKNIFKARNIFVEKAYELSNGKIKRLESRQSLNGNKKEDIELKKKSLLSSDKALSELGLEFSNFENMNPQDINSAYEAATSLGYIDYDPKVGTAINTGRHSAFLKLYERYFLNWNVIEDGSNSIILERKD